MFSGEIREIFKNAFFAGLRCLPLEILMNVFRNYIPNKTLKFDYERPPWTIRNISFASKERLRIENFYNNM